MTGPSDGDLRALLERHGVDPTPRTNEALRVRAVALRRGGQTIREVAGELGLPVSTLGAWLRNVKADNSCTAKAEGSSAIDEAFHVEKSDVAR